MKKLIFSTLVGSLLALAGCQQNEEIMDNSNTNGEKVTVTANIKGSTNGRVAMVDQENDGVKVTWKESGETFLVFNGNSNGTKYDTFTQVDGTSQFTGTLTGPFFMTAFYNYTIKNDEACYDLSTQNGTLDEKNVVMTGYLRYENEALTSLIFEHETFILKPTFKIGTTPVANNTISKIVMGGLENVNKEDANVKEITVTPSSLDDIYIFIMGESSHYVKDHVLTFDVIVNGQEYEGTYTLGKTLSAGYLYTAEVTLTEVVTGTPYVTFSAESAQTFKFSNASLGLEYSLDGGDFVALPADVNTTGITFGGTHGNLRLRGSLANGTNGDDVISFTDDDVDVTCSGDIRTLQAGESYASVTTSGNFTYLFYNCTALVSAQDLVLPAQTLDESCYYGMFNSCSKLTAAPVLNAMNLAESCYHEMFLGCTSLETAPVLPATTMAESCYRQMFEGCTSLTSAPGLGADELATECYFQMFKECTELITAPALPATTLAPSCYSSMFHGCTKLTTPPTISATTLAENCYAEMFSGCTSLETAPALPVTTLQPGCYKGMFYNCSQLTTAPELKAKTLVDYCYYYMFYGCSLLSSVTLRATNISAEYCLYSWLDGVAAEGVVYNNSFNKSQLGLPSSGWSVQSIP